MARIQRPALLLARSGGASLLSPGAASAGASPAWAPSSAHPAGARGVSNWEGHWTSPRRSATHRELRAVRELLPHRAAFAPLFSAQGVVLVPESLMLRQPHLNDPQQHHHHHHQQQQNQYPQQGSGAGAEPAAAQQQTAAALDKAQQQAASADAAGPAANSRGRTKPLKVGRGAGRRRAVTLKMRAAL